MGEVYSHLSEEERRVIRIEIGNGTIICGIVLMLGRNASTVGREIKRDTWFPSNENESYRPYRPKRLKTGPWTGGCYIAGPAAAQGRPQARRVFCQVGVGRFGVSFSPCERRVSGRFGVGRSCWLLVIALVIA
ncbi:integrase, catalytic region [Bifidobacterium longum subsp. longum]|uniref:hypothetical protein n=1 Tax=Bifidobacterium longum TaxID=216816 RepID=UPI0010E5F67C|nr:hypothetical protein [Bifidobacterium longum]TCE22858.1 integrase, catalytic region [Bifidobacterium longum subsp. longum]